MNSVRSRALDISIDENDVFDADKSHTGKDRWLYFRYTLEVDPVEGVPLRGCSRMRFSLESLDENRSLPQRLDGRTVDDPPASGASAGEARAAPRC